MRMANAGGTTMSLPPSGVGHGPLWAASTETPSANKWPATSTLPTPTSHAGSGVGFVKDDDDMHSSAEWPDDAVPTLKPFFRQDTRFFGRRVFFSRPLAISRRCPDCALGPAGISRGTIPAGPG